MRIVIFATAFGVILLINRWIVKTYWRFVAKRGDVLRRRQLRRDPWSGKMVATSLMILLVYLVVGLVSTLGALAAVASLTAWVFPNAGKSWIALTPIFIMLFAQIFFSIRYRSKYSRNLDR